MFADMKRMGISLQPIINYFDLNKRANDGMNKYEKLEKIFLNENKLNSKNNNRFIFDTIEYNVDKKSEILTVKTKHKDISIKLVIVINKEHNPEGELSEEQKKEISEALDHVRNTVSKYHYRDKKMLTNWFKPDQSETQRIETVKTKDDE